MRAERTCEANRASKQELFQRQRSRWGCFSAWVSLLDLVGVWLVRPPVWRAHAVPGQDSVRGDTGVGLTWFLFTI